MQQTLQPLNKSGLVSTVVSGIFIKTEGLSILCPRKKHHFITAGSFRQVFCIGKTGGGQPSLPVTAVGNHIFYQCIRPSLPR